jgi:hypothetical protein
MHTVGFFGDLVYCSFGSEKFFGNGIFEMKKFFNLKNITHKNKSGNSNSSGNKKLEEDSQESVNVGNMIDEIFENLNNQSRNCGSQNNSNGRVDNIFFIQISHFFSEYDEE